MKYLVLKQLGIDRKMKTNDSTTVPKNDSQSITVSRHFLSSSKKTRRFRSAFTTEQIQYLEREFKKFPYIGSGNRKEVSNILKIPERAVKIWFQNRRMKEKKEVINKEAEEEQRKIVVEGAGPSSIKSFNHQSHISQPYAVCQPKLKKIYPDPSITKDSIKHLSSNKKVCANESSKNIQDKQRIMGKNVDNRNYIETNNTRMVNKLSPTSRQLNSKTYAPMRTQNKNVCITKVLAQELPNPKLERKELGNPNNVTSDPQSCPQVQPRFYQINPNQDQRYMQLGQPLPQPPPFVPGNIVWKPVNMMPVLPGIATPPPQVHNNSFSILQPFPKEDCRCNCNAYNNQDMSSLMQMDGFRHLQSQYILAMPYNNHFDRI